MNLRKLFIAMIAVIGVFLTLLIFTHLLQPSQVYANPMGGLLNVQVICSSCGIDQDPGVPYVILLDQNTGNIWAYKDFDKKPIFLGKMTKIGMPATK